MSNLKTRLYICEYSMLIDDNDLPVSLPVRARTIPEAIIAADAIFPVCMDRTLTCEVYEEDEG